MQLKQLSFCKKCGIEFYTVNWENKKAQKKCRVCTSKYKSNKTNNKYNKDNRKPIP
jgi:hypothetical protein